MHVLVFDALIAACCGYALWKGGPPERVVGAALFVAYLATLASYTPVTTRFVRMEVWTFGIDLLLLVLLIAVALCADRAWPLVLAGLQLDTVSAHLLKGWDLDLIRVTYAIMIAGWSYPMLIVLALGTWRHQRRLRRHGDDPSWARPRRRIGPIEQANVHVGREGSELLEALP